MRSFFALASGVTLAVVGVQCGGTTFVSGSSDASLDVSAEATTPRCATWE
jgi:hypothetical protein